MCRVNDIISISHRLKLERELGNYWLTVQSDYIIAKCYGQHVTTESK